MTNLQPYSSFEVSGALPLGYDWAPSLDGAHVRVGSYAIKQSPHATTAYLSWGTVSAMRPSVVGGTTYTFSIWCYPDAPMDIGIGIEWFIGTQYYGNSGIVPTAVTPNVWNQRVATVTAPANMNNGGMLLVTANTQTGRNVWFDTAKFEVGTVATAWEPGPGDPSTTTVTLSEHGSSTTALQTADGSAVVDLSSGGGGYLDGYLVGYGSFSAEAGRASDTFSVIGLGHAVLYETGSASDTFSASVPPQLPGYSSGYITAGYLGHVGASISLFEMGHVSDALYTGKVYETGGGTDSLSVQRLLFDSAAISDVAFAHAVVVDFAKPLATGASALDTMQIVSLSQPTPHGLGLAVVVRSGAGGMRTIISGGTLAVVLKTSQSSAALRGDRGWSAAVVQ